MRLGHSSSWALTVRAESHCTAPPPRTALLFLSTYLPHAELAQSTNYRSCRSRAAIMKPLTTLPLSQAQDSPHSYPLCILYTSLWGLIFLKCLLWAAVRSLMAYLFNWSNHWLSSIRGYGKNQPWEQKNKCLPNLWFPSIPWKDRSL